MDLFDFSSLTDPVVRQSKISNTSKPIAFIRIVCVLIIRNTFKPITFIRIHVS